MTTLRSQMKAWSLALAAVLVTVGGGAQPAARADISQTVFTIQATNDSGTATHSVDFGDGAWNPVAQTYSWSLPSPVNLMDAGTPIATLQSASLTIQMTPVPHMALDIGVLAGSSHTSFFADSALVSFATLPASVAAGQFIASASVWDDGGAGMTLMGLGSPGIGALRSYYNGPEPVGTKFSDLVAVVQGSSGFASQSASYPNAFDYEPIGVDVNDMSIHAAFLLTADDRASVTTGYGLVPEPSGMALLVLGTGLAFGRRWCASSLGRNDLGATGGKGGGNLRG